MILNRTYFKLIAVFIILLSSCNEDRIGEFNYGTIEGKVVSEGANVPIPNTRVSTQPITSTVFTDSIGNFTIENVPYGEFAVQARKDDFISGLELTNVLENSVVNVIFELQPSTANNKPPTTPLLVAPTQNQVLQSTEVIFEFLSIDIDGDPITYTLEVRNDQNEEVLLFEDITENIFTYSQLQLGVQYFWQVTATDNINSPVLSPLGTFSVINANVDNRFLFVRNINGNNVIFSADDSGNEFQLTSDDLNSYRPRRNVAANRIAFLQSDGAAVDIYTMKRDGSDKVRVTSTVKPNGFNLNEINFSWPPTSDKIYFPQLDKLYRINSNGQGLELVYQTTDGSLISEVAASETANIIALKTNNLDGYNVSIFTIDFSGNILDTVILDAPGAASGLNISVTNKLLLYSYDVSEFQNISYRRLDSRIFVYDWDSDITYDISQSKPSGTNDLEPVFSPNEAFAVFTNTSNDGISQKNVYETGIILEDDTTDNTRLELYTNAFMPDSE